MLCNCHCVNWNRLSWTHAYVFRDDVQKHYVRIFKHSISDPTLSSQQGVLQIISTDKNIRFLSKLFLWYLCAFYIFLSHLHDNQQVHDKDERRQKGSREFIGGDKVSVESIPPNKVTYYSSGDNCRGNNKHNPEQIDSCVSSSPNLPQTFVPVWIQLVLKKQKYEKTSINMLSFKVNLAGGLQFSK